MRRSTTLSALNAPTSTRLVQAALAALLVLSALVGRAVLPPSVRAAETYDNPLVVTSPFGPVESCADPSTIYADDGFWYTYCTTDPLNSADRNTEGGFNFRKIPTLRSADLVTWEYVNDAFAAPPDWAEPTAGMWAPEIELIGDTYYLF